MAKEPKSAKSFLEIYGKFNAVEDAKLEWPRLLTGSINYDVALGGGWPSGTLGVIWGPESSYKSAIAQIICGQAQADGRYVVWIDAESSFRSFIAQKNGMEDSADKMFLMRDHDKFRLCYENVISFLFDLARDKPDAIVVLDSLHALLPLAMMNTKKKADSGSEDDSGSAAGTMDGGAFGGPKARLNSIWLPQIRALCLRTGLTVICIAQARVNMNKINKYDDDWLLTGGQALKQYSSVSVFMHASTWVNSNNSIKDSAGQVVGRRVRVAVKKNKFGMENVIAYIPCRQDLPGRAVDDISEICDLALSPKTKVVETRGAWIDFDGRSWNGKESFRLAVENDDELRLNLRSAIYANLYGTDATVNADDLLEREQEESVEDPEQLS
jgi:RecA/RadA recombinase